ncbi:hypothetical protein HZB01_04425 [Candidatus Woesearchaeota archaeon]|nr:hypothetical protein [Candidatus Woesearchaeota archaeon]
MEHKVIALVYDFDKTLSLRDMQHALFERGWFPHITEAEFWQEVDQRKKREREAFRQVDPILIYTSLFVESARPGGPLEGLTQARFAEAGDHIHLLAGIPAFFGQINHDFHQNPANGDITLEHYILSAGIADMLRGSPLDNYMAAIDACEFLYDANGVPISVSYAMNPTMKTGALFKVNKGCYHDSLIDVNTKIPPSQRRVPFSHILYFGDGATDVPAMALLKDRGGTSILVHGDDDTIVKRLVEEGRASTHFRYDYRKGSPLYNEVIERLNSIAQKILT